jgi:hypothetical protein
MVTLMEHVLAGLAVAFAWFTFCYFCPRKACRKCSGWGSRQRRRGRTACGRCKGTGRIMRLSARIAHHAVHVARLQVRECIGKRRGAV